MAQTVSNVWRKTDVDHGDESTRKHYQCSFTWRTKTNMGAYMNACTGRMLEIYDYPEDEGEMSPNRIDWALIRDHHQHCSLGIIDQTRGSLHVKGALSIYAQIHKTDLTSAIALIYDRDDHPVRPYIDEKTPCHAALERAGYTNRVTVDELESLLANPTTFVRNWRTDLNNASGANEQISYATKWVKSSGLGVRVWTVNTATQAPTTRTNRAMVCVYDDKRTMLNKGEIDKSVWSLQATPNTNNLQWQLYTIVAQQHNGLATVVAHFITECISHEILESSIRAIADYLESGQGCRQLFPGANASPIPQPLYTTSLPGHSPSYGNCPSTWIIQGHKEELSALEAVYGKIGRRGTETSGPVILYCQRESLRLIDEAFPEHGREGQTRRLILHAMLHGKSTEGVRAAHEAAVAELADLAFDEDDLAVIEGHSLLTERFDPALLYRWSKAGRAGRAAWRHHPTATAVADFSAAYAKADGKVLAYYTLAGVFDRCVSTAAEIDSRQLKQFARDAHGYYDASVFAALPLLRDLPLSAQKLASDELTRARMDIRMGRLMDPSIYLADLQRGCCKCRFWRTWRLPCRHWWRMYLENEAKVSRQNSGLEDTVHSFEMWFRGIGGARNPHNRIDSATETDDETVVGGNGDTAADQSEPTW